MEEKKKGKKKIIAIIIVVLLLIIGILAVVFVPIVKNSILYSIGIKQYESQQYENAYNTFTKLDAYKDIEEYKAKCITEGKQEIENCINNKEYAKALKLCDFISSKEEIKEMQEKVIKGYFEQLEERGEYEKAYNMLEEMQNIPEESKQKAQQNYMIFLIENNNTEKGMELLRNTKGLTEDNITKVLQKYITKTVYPKAYNELYNSMKNPSSLNVRSATTSVLFFNSLNYSDKNNKASFTYKKGFPYFQATITITASGTNSYGGVVTDNSKYVYEGKVNEDYTLKDINLRWNY